MIIINQFIGLLALLALTIVGILLGVCLTKKMTVRAVLCGMLAAVMFGMAGHYLSLPSSGSAAKYLERGESVMAVATFTEMQNDGRDVQKAVVKISGGYMVLELPPLKDFNQSEKAYRIGHSPFQQAGLLKVEQIANEFGPDLTLVSFKPNKEDPQSRWNNTGKN